jgi:hypothetical protein
MPADKEPFNDSSDSSDSKYDPHENHPHNCDLSAPGSDADSNFFEEGSNDKDNYIPEKVDPELYEQLYVLEPKERDCLVECNSNHPNRRRGEVSCQGDGMGYRDGWLPTCLVWHTDLDVGTR